MPDDATKPALLDAIDATLQTLERRAKHYRNLVVAVSLAMLVSIGTALFTWHALPLLGLASAVPLVAAFAYADARLVNRWIAAVHDLRDVRALDVDHFATTVRQLKYLPQAPLRAMLDALERRAS